jgi:hypothetical protein
MLLFQLDPVVRSEYHTRRSLERGYCGELSFMNQAPIRSVTAPRKAGPPVARFDAIGREPDILGDSGKAVPAPEACFSFRVSGFSFLAKAL